MSYSSQKEASKANTCYSIGPVAGGYLVEAAGWRWVYWVIAIAEAVFSVLAVIVMRESYAPVILARKAARLRKETGNEALRSKLDTGLTPKELLVRSLIRPSKMLVFSPIVAAMSIYMALIYGIMYLLFTTFTFVFEGQYGFSSGNVGLTYIALGIGMFVGLGVMGVGSDKIIKAAQARGETLKPELRIPLRLTMPGSIAIPIGLFIYGWTAQYHIQWAVPLFGTLLVGFGLIALFVSSIFTAVEHSVDLHAPQMTIQTYLIDAFTIHAASAIAANTVLRSVFGALLPLSGLKLYDALGTCFAEPLVETLLTTALQVWAGATVC